MDINQKAYVKTIFIGLLIVIVAAIIGAGIYINFIKTDNNTNNNLENKEKGKDTLPANLTNTEYKTFDSKHSIKIASDEKMYLDGKELKEQRARVMGNKYMQIFVDFVPSSGYITDMTFILDKENKVIVEQPDYEAAKEDTDAFGVYGKFSSRTGIKLLSVSGYDFITFESEGPTEVYTTSWKKLGYLVSELKYDASGIYVCNNFDDNFNCIKESKYDVDGNLLN